VKKNTGNCFICSSEYSKQGFTRHLKTCIEDLIQKNAQKNKPKRDVYLLQIEATYCPKYYMYILIDQKATLKLLDDFIRGIWVECCGHLSEFHIDYYSYICDYEEHSHAYGGDFNYGMNFSLDQVLDVGEQFSYEYDFGSTTDLRLSIKAAYSNIVLEDAVTIVARNNAPKNDSDNSPRSGVCGYVADVNFQPSQLDLKKYPVSEFSEEIWDEDWDEDELLDVFEEPMMDIINQSFYDNIIQGEKLYIDGRADTLKQCLQMLNKEDVYEVSKWLGMTGVSSYTKARLIQALEHHVLQIFPHMLTYMSSEQFHIIKKAASNDGRIDLPVSTYLIHGKRMITQWIQKMLLFPTYDSTMEMIGFKLPKELVEIVNEVNEKEYISYIKRNTECIDIVRGLIYYYGVSSFEDLHEWTIDYTKNHYDIKTFKYIIHQNLPTEITLEADDELVWYIRVLDPDELIEDIEEQRTINSNLNYKKIHKQKLLEVDSVYHYVQNQKTYALEKYLKKYYNMDAFDIQEVMTHIMAHMDLCQSPMQLPEVIPRQLDIPSTTVRNEIMEYIINIYNANRQWVLLGYAPDEIRETPKNIHIEPKVTSNVTAVNFAKKKKIGRNDPCPCGSGKKYKHCCGR